MTGNRIGIIGGSGLYQMDGLEILKEQSVETPFGAPSGAYQMGRLEGADVVFLPRHGRGHRLNPSEVPYRANIFGMKRLGVDWIVSVTAVGSLREDVHPGDVVLVDQFIDRTRGRPTTFFEEGIVAHVAFGEPMCGELRALLGQAAANTGVRLHREGTYVCIEGPTFSTRAESDLYRSWGAAVVGMTNLTEARLAREAEIAFATLAMVTDFDCWHPEHGQVTAEQVMKVLRTNTEHARRIIREVVPAVHASKATSSAHHALADALLTQRDAISPKRAEQLEPIVGKYL